MHLGTFKGWDTHLAKATWFICTRGSDNQAGQAKSEFLCNVKGDKIPVVHIKNMLEETVCIIPASGKSKHICGIELLHWGAALWVIWDNGEVQDVSQGDLILGDNSQ